ncbi:hypothetical protein LTR62_000320 [Meristemomyces frigidus]|uniref:Uncharacterized protein n=1 Tax=Meristemomyces frigidus TaxID=1508187 RepID=A0AAN7TZF9_9PEZI|nr:hypothetical protein LTR62_000320 [Meristemomyces frigidus]
MGAVAEEELERVVGRLVVDIALTGTFGYESSRIPIRVGSLYSLSRGASSQPAESNNANHDNELDDALLDNIWNRLTGHGDIDDTKFTRHSGQSDHNEDLAEEDASTPQRFPQRRPSRIFATQQRMWFELTGHNVDHTRVPPFEWEILCVVGAYGAAGIQQGHVRDITGQQKQSLPARTDSLARKGLILKTASYVFHTESSLLRLKRLVSEDPKDDSSDAKRRATAFDGRGRLVADLAAFVEQSLALLRQQPGHIMALRDLGAALGFYENGHDGTTILLRCLRRYVDAGCMERCMAKASSGTGSPTRAGGHIRCVRLVRELTAEERMLLLNPRLNMPMKPKKPRNHKRAIYDDLDESEADAPGEDDSGAEEPTNTSRGPLQQPDSPPQYAPTRILPDLLFGILLRAGQEGVTFTQLRVEVPKAVSDQAINVNLAALTSQTSDASRSLSAWTTTAAAGDSNEQRYFAQTIQQDVVEDSTAADAEDTSGANTVFDNWGFPEVDTQLFVNGDGRASLSECRPVANPYTPATAHDQSTARVDSDQPRTKRQYIKRSLAKMQNTNPAPLASASRTPKPVIRVRLTTQHDQEEFKLWAGVTAERLARTAVRQTVLPPPSPSIHEVATNSDLTQPIDESDNELVKATSIIKAEILSRQRPGLYINPPGAKDTKAQFHVQRGRPRRALIAVIKSAGLEQFAWFEEESAARTVPLAPDRKQDLDGLVGLQAPTQDAEDVTSVGIVDADDHDTQDERDDEQDGVTCSQSCLTDTKAPSGPRISQPATALGLVDDNTIYSKTHVLTHLDETFHHVGHGSYRRGPRPQNRKRKSVEAGHADKEVGGSPGKGFTSAAALDTSRSDDAADASGRVTSDAKTGTSEGADILRDENEAAGCVGNSTLRHQSAGVEAVDSPIPPVQLLSTDTSDVLMGNTMPADDTRATENDNSAALASTALGPTSEDSTTTQPLARIRSEYKYDILTSPINSGGTAARRNELLIHFVTVCGGVYPGNKEVYYPLATTWKALRQGTPHRSRVDQSIKMLLDTNRLRKVTFSFRTKLGMNEIRAVLTLPGIDPLSLLVDEMKRAIIKAYPQHYFPSAAVISEEFMVVARAPSGKQKAKRVEAVSDEQPQASLASEEAPTVPERMEVDDVGTCAPDTSPEQATLFEKATEVVPSVISDTTVVSEVPIVGEGRNEPSGTATDSEAVSSVAVPDLDLAVAHSSLIVSATQDENISTVASPPHPIDLQAGEQLAAEQPVTSPIPDQTRLAGREPALYDLEDFPVIPDLVVERTEQGLKMPAFELAPDRVQSHRRKRRKILVDGQDLENEGQQATPAKGPWYDYSTGGRKSRAQAPVSRRPRRLHVILQIPPPMLDLIDKGVVDSEWLRLAPGTVIHESSGTFGTKGYWPPNTIEPAPAKTTKRKRRRSGVLEEGETAPSVISLAKLLARSEGRRDMPFATLSSGEGFHEGVFGVVTCENGGYGGYGGYGRSTSSLPEAQQYYRIQDPGPGSLVEYDMPLSGGLSQQESNHYIPLQWIDGRPSGLLPSQGTVGRPRETTAIGADLQTQTHEIRSPAADHLQISRTDRPWHKPGKRKVGELSTESSVHDDDWIPYNQANQGHEPQRKKRKAEPEELARFTSSEADDLVATLALVKTLCSGLAQTTIPWDLVSHAFAFRHDGTFLSMRWQMLKMARSPEVQALQEALRGPFLTAYEQGSLPHVDFRDLSATDWPALVAWVKLEVVPQVKVKSVVVRRESDSGPPVVNLPSTLHGLQERYEVLPAKDPFGPDLQLYHNSVTDHQRTSIALNLVHGKEVPAKNIPLPAIATASIDLLLIKSWCRAVSVTPEASYNAAAASQKLSTLPASQLKQAIDELLDDHIISAEKKGRHLPGRNFHLDKSVHKELSRWPGDSTAYLRELATAHHRITSTLFIHDTIQLNHHTSDADIVVLTNLVAQNQLKVVSVLPPLNNDPDAPFPRLSIWGIDEPSTIYNSNNLKSERMRFPVVYHKTASYVAHHGLSSEVKIPVPLYPETLAHEPRAARIPLWVSIHGHLVPDLWEKVLASILHLVVFRPGITASGVGRALKGKLWEWEIREALVWMERKGVVVGFGEGRGWRAGEGWFGAFAPDVATWRTEGTEGTE